MTKDVFDLMYEADVIRNMLEFLIEDIEKHYPKGGMLETIKYKNAAIERTDAILCDLKTILKRANKTRVISEDIYKAES